MPNLAMGVNYAWGDVALMLFGNSPIIGVAAIEYKEKQDMEVNFAAGNFGQGIGYGNFKCSGKLRLYRETILDIVALAQAQGIPGGKIQLIPPFNIKVVYGSSTSVPVTDTLVSCVFMDNPFETKQGDKKMEVDVEILIGDINWNS
jgi:hypothetical protein